MREAIFVGCASFGQTGVLLSKEYNTVRVGVYAVLSYCTTLRRYVGYTLQCL